MVAELSIAVMASGAMHASIEDNTQITGKPAFEALTEGLPTMRLRSRVQSP